MAGRNVRAGLSPAVWSALAVLGAAAAFSLWQRPACGWLSTTGLKCPGCGATRSAAALLRGQIGEAFYWHALLVPGLLTGLVLLWRRPGPGRVRTALLVGLAALAIVFTIVRNLPFYLLY